MLRFIWRHYLAINILSVIGILFLRLFELVSFSTYFLLSFLFFVLHFLFNGWSSKMTERAYFMRCDPEPYLELALACIYRYRKPRTAAQKNALGVARLAANSALSALGRDQEALEYLKAVNVRDLTPVNCIIYFHDYFVTCHHFGRIEPQMLAMAKEAFEKVSLPRIQREMVSETLFYDQLLLQFWQEGTSESLEAQFSELLSQTKTERNRVSYHMTLAQCALDRNDHTAARAHLEYVAAHGNKLYIRTEAEELLRTLPEKEKAVADPTYQRKYDQ